MLQGETSEADTPTIRLNATPSGLISDPAPSFLPFLRQMPFQQQPSQFILARDRHQICWLAYPVAWFHMISNNHTTTVLWPFFWDHPGEPVPEENFWTLWCKGRLREADTLTIWLGATPSGLTSAYLHHLPII